MNAAALNALISPWFVRTRPAALAAAFNGGSCGGVIFSPLWVMSIGSLGFSIAAATIGLVMTVVIWVLANRRLSRTPEQMGLAPDGDAPGPAPQAAPVPAFTAPLPGSRLWRDARFVTLAAGMSLGMFAQIGLISHLFSLLAPVLGTNMAGLALGLITATSMAGRTLVGRLMPAGADRRIVACAGYAAQLAGCLVLASAAANSIPLLLLGLTLFGLGFGNANLLPPLIAQVEFARDDVARVVGLIFGIAQATFAFAPAAFGLIRALAPDAGSLADGIGPQAFVAAALLQALAIGAFLLGRRA